MRRHPTVPLRHHDPYPPSPCEVLMDVRRIVSELRSIPDAVRDGRWPADANPADDDSVPDWLRGRPRVIRISGPAVDIPEVQWPGGSQIGAGPTSGVVVGGWTPVAGGGGSTLGESKSDATDRLAWYRSFHYGYAWGIFVRTHGVDVIAAVLERQGFRRQDAQAIAFRFLVRHEMGHLQTDLAVTAAELLGREALFLPGRALQKSGAPPYGLAEEGLCNALARETLPRGSVAFLDAWLNNAPSGYRDYAKHKRSNRAESWNETVGGACNRPNVPWSIPPLLSEQVTSQVPVYKLIDQGYDLDDVCQGIVGPVADIVETRSFLKDMEGSGNSTRLRRLWSTRRSALSNGHLDGGTQLKRIDRDKYRVKLSRSIRVGLVRQDQSWFAVMLDQQHDRFYRRFQGLTLPVRP